MTTRLRKYFFLFGLLLLVFAFTQLPQQNNRSRLVHLAGTCTTGVFGSQNNNKRAVPYVHLRQADVSLEKRIWRVIDLREKINQPLMYPIEPTNCRRSLIDVVKYGIQKGKITAFADDEFIQEYSGSEALDKLVVNISIDVIDSLGNSIGKKEVADTLSSLKITHVKLKEDWFFDKQRSVLEVRILALGFEWYDENKDLYKPIFWLYYPQCRDWFVNFNVFNNKNDIEQRSYDEIFIKRMFNSYIEKESNRFDRPISSYTAGIETLLESERIKDELYKWEQDLWHY
jgi:gliding motility associated protien GldN